MEKRRRNQNSSGGRRANGRPEPVAFADQDEPRPLTPPLSGEARRRPPFALGSILCHEQLFSFTPSRTMSSSGREPAARSHAVIHAVDPRRKHRAMSAPALIMIFMVFFSLARRGTYHGPGRSRKTGNLGRARGITCYAAASAAPPTTRPGPEPPAAPAAALFQEPPRNTRRPGAGQAPGTGCPRGANHPSRKIARRSRHVPACAACATQARTRCSTSPRVTVPARQRSRSPRRRLRKRRTFASGSRRRPPGRSSTTPLRPLGGFAPQTPFQDVKSSRLKG